MTPFSIAMIAFISPLIPAAGSACPTLLFIYQIFVSSESVQIPKVIKSILLHKPSHKHDSSSSRAGMIVLDRAEGDNTY